MITVRDEEIVQWARNIAKLSPDLSRQTACILVTPHEVDFPTYTIGYNNFPMGVLITPERLERPLKYVFTEHAERNAIYQAAAAGVKLGGCTAYLNWYPCADCARALVQIGCLRLVAVEPDWGEERYGFKQARMILEEGGVYTEYVK